ncbi:hypothetical protein AGMMS50262_19300 [Bacteroidia bacterium]|nr:hypothetical protein AGMMS50262_19300 [Bacteroidia bacterium]
MKTYKNIFILILLIGSCFSINIVCGQNFIPTSYNAYFFQPQSLGTSTPQVTDMIRYGNVQVNKYHGLLDFGVALDGYKDRDFYIPISLKYISSGFMPAKRPSAVGYNWVLNCGGMITRTLNGSPDDTRGKAVNSGEARDYLLDGMLVAIRENRFTNYSDANLMNFNVDLNAQGQGTPYLAGDFKYEMEPDIFTFSFGNYYGRFIIGNNGIPVLLEENGCKIDITGMPIQSYSTTATPIASSITITTPDGYIYTFGGNSNYLEYFIPNNPEKCKIMPRYITSWFLKSIKAPNNRQVNFSYHSKIQLNKYRYIAYTSTASSSTQICSPIGYGGAIPENIISYTENPIVKDKIYAPILDSICVDNISLRFTYDENVASVYSDESTDKAIQLKKIAHYVNNTKLKEAELTYQTKDRYFFLKSVSQKGLKHEFNYNLSTTLPNPLTISTDHWGFWAGGYDTEASDWNTYCPNMKNNRETNSTVCNVGLLNEIIYPTGGKTKITYEYNRYNTYFTRSTTSTNLIKQELNTTKACGGARVSMIEDFETQTSTTPINSRQFQYRDATNKEVGVIGIEPKYHSSEAYWTISSSPFTYTIPECTTYEIAGNPFTYCIDMPHVGSCTVTSINANTCVSGNSFGSNNLFSEYHVAYPYVKEVFANNGSIQYKFSSHLDVPDSYNTGVKKLTPIETSAGTYEIAEKYGTYFTNDMSRFRGRLLEEKVYDTSGNIVLQKTNIYNLADATTKYSISLKSSPRSLGCYKIYQTPCLLVQQDITDKNNVLEQTFYTYTTRNFLRSTLVVNSKGEEYMKRYRYIGDYSLNVPNNIQLDIAIISTMINRYNMKGVLAEEQTLIKKDGNWNLTSGKLIRNGHSGVFIDGHELMLPYREYSIELSGPTTDIKESDLKGPGLLDFHSAYKERVVYNQYNSYGNPVFITKDSTENIVYLWGYKGQYPIAEIKNATYDQVKTALGETLINRVASAYSPSTADSTAIYNLRSNANLPNAQVTTYSYKPLVGLQTAIDPRGVKTTYHYDTYGRLEAIKDENGKKMEEYKYNYKE